MSDTANPTPPGQSAPGQERTTAEATPATDSLRSPQFVVSIFAILMIGGGFGYNTVYGDAGTKQMVLTALIGLSGVVYGFWLGSSKSSQSKDDKIPPVSVIPPQPIPPAQGPIR